jgi:hypothetical protein
MSVSADSVEARFSMTRGEDPDFPHGRRFELRSNIDVDTFRKTRRLQLASYAWADRIAIAVPPTRTIR